jgi:hypothetical protein
MCSVRLFRYAKSAPVPLQSRFLLMLLILHATTAYASRPSCPSVIAFLLTLRSCALARRAPTGAVGGEAPEYVLQRTRPGVVNIPRLVAMPGLYEAVLGKPFTPAALMKVLDGVIGRASAP